MITTKTSKSRTFLTYAIPCAIGSGCLLATADATAFAVDFPAGIACSFELGLDLSGGHQVYREFLDKNGNVVRWLSAGKGSALTFTNVSSGKTLSLSSNGFAWHVTNHSDGSSTWVTTGHNVLILFPTDVPAGPSTTLYVGRVVFTVDSGGNYALETTSGRATDICAALT